MLHQSHILEALREVGAGRNLSREQAQAAFDEILSGMTSDDAIAELLTALARKGETPEEIAGAADAISERAVRVACSTDCVDTCGTGGDGISTFNTSTAAAIIAAGAGAVVAKHGNRTNTRVSGSAEVISELGVNLDAPVPVLEKCLAECGLAFLYAPNLHPAFRHVAPVRKKLGIRTIFNLLGPLCNPAGAKRQLMGVPRVELTQTLAGALAARGATLAWVVHGHDGLCDLSITGPSQVTETRDGALRTFMVHPDDVGLPPADLNDLLVGSPRQSAAVILEILDGVSGPPRHHAVLNAGAALVIAGVASDLTDGVRRAELAIDSGTARRKLEQLVNCSRSG